MSPRTWHFGIDRESTDRVLILSLVGRLGARSAPLLRGALAMALSTDAFSTGTGQDPSTGSGRDASTGSGQDTTSGVLVDMGRLDYISGSGLSVVHEAAAEAAARGRSFVLCGLEGSVRIAFELAGLLPALTVETSRRPGVARASS